MQKMDLSGRPRTREELAGWYSAVLEEQASSGLSIAEYADELGVTATTLYQWRRRLGPQDAGEPDLPRPFGLVEVVARDDATTGYWTSTFVRSSTHSIIS